MGIRTHSSGLIGAASLLTIAGFAAIAVSAGLPGLDIPPHFVEAMLISGWLLTASGILLFLVVAVHGIINYAAGPPRSGVAFADGFCVQCGYNLTGNTSGTCPECGLAASPAHRSTSPQVHSMDQPCDTPQPSPPRELDDLATAGAELAAEVWPHEDFSDWAS